MIVRRVMAALLALWPGRNWRFYKFFQMKDSAQCIRQLGSVCIASSAPGERAHQVCAALPELQTWRCRIAKHMGPDLTDSVLQDLLIWQKLTKSRPNTVVNQVDPAAIYLTAAVVP